MSLNLFVFFNSEIFYNSDFPMTNVLQVRLFPKSFVIVKERKKFKEKKLARIQLQFHFTPPLSLKMKTIYNLVGKS